VVTREELDRDWSGKAGTPLWATRIDGLPVAILRGCRGDHRIRFGSAAFQLSADGRTLSCDAADLDAPTWQRFLLDTVLWCTSLLAGFEQLHASSVLIDGRVAAILARSGGGKTSIAAELVRRGYPLFSDDVVALGSTAGRPLAHAGPRLMNLPEDGLDPSVLGRPLARIGGEAWIEVRRGIVEPAPLSALFLCGAREGAARSEPLSPSPLRLLPHALALPCDGERRRSRFELLADVAASTPLFALAGGGGPKALADEVEVAVAAHAPALEAAL
jgi:hypothetical protein